ncbi:unnamed protein product [Oikopleura dioica]|uniref:ABC transmembrane type-1 domain-containing protein n=1 Tax=Oikopleura dioica TaxID=34765 RepID=E4Y8T4_OIKDI|nr:unnamed protein product [Oikopleura dioica]
MGGTEEEKKKEEPTKKVPYFSLYRYASGKDKLLIAVAWLCAVISGVADPAMIIFFGKSVNDFATAGKFVACENDKDALLAEFLESDESLDIGLSQPMGENILYFVILGCVVWVTGFVQTSCLMLSSENQINRLRAAYFSAIAS